jgi:hypothetical protein
MPAKAKTAPKHPTYFDMVKEAIAATGKPVKGASRPSITKYLVAKYGKVVGTTFKGALRLALRSNVAKGLLVQTKGSFRLAKAAKKEVKKKVKKVKKPRVKKAKKPKAKKASGPKKAAKSKTAAKKAKVTKSKAKKVTKPKAKKAPKAAAEAPKAVV